MKAYSSKFLPKCLPQQSFPDTLHQGQLLKECVLHGHCPFHSIQNIRLKLATVCPWLNVDSDSLI